MLTEPVDFTQDVVGSWIGSSLGWFVAAGIPTTALGFILLAVGFWPLQAAISIFVACMIAAWWYQRLSRVTVSSRGIVINLFGVMTEDIPWSNVSRIEARRFSGSLVFRDPQPIGWRSGVKKFAFIAYDPKWREKPTTRAVEHWLRVTERSADG